jgi:hypothetical protein
MPEDLAGPEGVLGPDGPEGPVDGYFVDFEGPVTLLGPVGAGPLAAVDVYFINYFLIPNFSLLA